jgi:inner membrane protein
MSDTTPTFQDSVPNEVFGPPRAATAWVRSPSGKIVMILGLVLLMQIPAMMVSGLIAEREARQQEVQANFTRGWGAAQSFAGPVLVVPYYGYTATNGPTSAVEVEGWMRIAPTQSHISATLKPEIRRRGLFRAIVYRASITLSGAFSLPRADIKEALAGKIDWSGARLVLGATDLRGLTPEARLDWNGGDIALAGANTQDACGMQMMSVPAPFAHGAPLPGSILPFNGTLVLRGTEAFHVAAFGQHLTVDIASPWSSPSFVGAMLPLNYQQDRAGFGAHWDLGDSAEPSGWHAADTALPTCSTGVETMRFNQQAQLGVELQDAVPTYLMVSRASKYGVLFLVLSYLTLFLFEVVARVRIHIVQYGLLGLSVALFALMLISVSEPLGFVLGYAISTVCVLLQSSLYTLSVVRRARLAAVFAAVLATLFGFLFIVISLDAYALLAGTVALFSILSVVMFVTRKLDWSGATG